MVKPITPILTAALLSTLSFSFILFFFHSPITFSPTPFQTSFIVSLLVCISLIASHIQYLLSFYKWLFCDTVFTVYASIELNFHVHKARFALMNHPLKGFAPCIQ